MSEYQAFVHHLAVNRINQRFLNSDEEKMRSVFVELFNGSNSNVRIFAGNLCNGSVETPLYIEALSDFIERKGSLQILLNNYDPEAAKASNLFKRLAYYISEGYSISIKQTSAKPYLTAPNKGKQYVHFSTGDNQSYRLETDLENRTAICNMNDPTFTGKLVDLFDKIFNDGASAEINFNDLIN